MDRRDADMKAELDARAELAVEPPQQSMAELARMNAARTSVTIVKWQAEREWEVAVLSCGHEIRVPFPFGNRHPPGRLPTGTTLSCEECRAAKLREGE